MMLQGYCGDFSETHLGYTHSIPVVTYSLHLLLSFLNIFKQNIESSEHTHFTP